MGYVELHCHSAYSFLDGASQPEELVIRAAELGYEALALTDHDGVYGSLEFAHAAKAFGVRPITGAEVTLEGGSHVTLLVETPRGLREPLPAAHPARTRATGSSRRCLWRARRAERRPRLPVRLRPPRPRVSAIPTPPRASPRRLAASGSSSSSSARTSAATPPERRPARPGRDAGRPDGGDRRRTRA